MTVKVLRRAGDTSKPATIEVETTFNIGDRFEMEYDWCTQKECMNGYNLNADVPRLYRRRVPFQNFSGGYNLPLKP